jgi:hypothetical protein
VAQDTADLSSSNTEEEEVDTGKEQVSGLDDEAPSSPDQSRAHEGGVLREGELIGGTGEVGGTGKDETPLRKHKDQFKSFQYPEEPSELKISYHTFIIGAQKCTVLGPTGEFMNLARPDSAVLAASAASVAVDCMRR